MSTSPETLFPANPTHGMLFEQKNGVIYQYDAAIRSWVKLASDNMVLPLATPIRDGAMTSDDLKKLNRLVIPPPTSSIIGNDCTSSYKQGTIGLFSGDEFVSVNGQLDIQNIDQFGDFISDTVPFQIHQHTYGFDFTLDVQQLILELEKRGQIRLVGQDGIKGDAGDQGEPGINGILAGPPGDKGESGSSLPCEMSIEPEVFQAQPRPGLKRALTDVRVVSDVVDEQKYYLEFDRQVVGNEEGAASQFRVRQVESTWILTAALLTDESTTAANSIECGTIPGERRRTQSYALYYVDIEPILSTIHSKYLDEVKRLKKGYEDIVSFWIQTMSDMFDEQKDALCCALENCISGTKSIHAREHMETVAALALGKAKIVLNGRKSKEAVELSSTRLLRELGGPDLCKGGPKFPENPVTQGGGNDGTVTVANQAAQPFAPILVDIDPLLNSSASNSKKVELPGGNYVATIKEATAQINNTHRSNVKIRYASDGERKITQFLDKGSFKSLTEAKSAYEGLSLSFKHDGGMIELFLPSIQTRQFSGNVKILIQSSNEAAQEPESVKPKHERKQTKPNKTAIPSSVETCQMTTSHLAWYEKGWISGKCCGLVVNISGQDYIIIKRSIGDEDNCGGGESLDTPCIAKFNATYGHPAFAWPTFDGKTFASVPNSESVTFQYDKSLNDLVSAKISNLEYSDGVGNPSGVRHLSYQLMTVLFPVAN